MWLIDNMASVSKLEKDKKTSKIKRTFKFPPALYIIFFVLLFCVVLTWIPHKEWVNLNDPLLVLKKDDVLGLGIFSADGKTLLIKIEGLATKGGTLTLTGPGYELLHKFYPNLTPSNTSGLCLEFSSLNYLDGWEDATINWGGLTFDLTISGLNSSDVNKTSDSIIINVTADQVHQDVLKNEFLIYKITLVNPDNLIWVNDKEVAWSTTFISGNTEKSWYNFWNTNYYMGNEFGRYGLLNIPFLLIAGFFKSITIIFYLVCIAAFMQVIIQSGALEVGIVALIKKMQGRVIILVVLFYLFFAFCGTTFGMQGETLGFIPIIVPFLVLAGFDTMTGVLIISIGTTSGICASVLDPFSVGIMASMLEDGEGNTMAISDGMIIRMVEFAFIATFGASYCSWYANKSRKGIDYVAEPKQYAENKKWAEDRIGEFDCKKEDKMTTRQIVGLVFFALTFVWMVFVLLPWTTWFEGLQDPSPSSPWYILSWIFFANAPFGKWGTLQLAIFFLFQAIFISLILGMKPSRTQKAMANGPKVMFKPILIIIISRAVSIVLINSGLTMDMISMMFSGGTDSIGSMGQIGLAWILFPFFLLLAFFIPSTSGLAGITGPVLSPILDQLATNSNGTINFAEYALVVLLVFPLAEGMINMCAPTVGIVLAQSEASHVSYPKAFKYLASASLSIGIIAMTVISLSLVVV